MNKSSIFVLKEHGLRYMLLISSNAFKDREFEIVAQKAIDQYVANFEPGAPVLFWHGGDPIGEIIGAERMGAFLVEIARELPDAQIDLSRLADESPFITTVKEVWDAIEANESGIDWGASIGFRHQKGDEQDGVYSDILKFETSILPVEDAANVITNMFIVRGAENV